MILYRQCHLQMLHNHDDSLLPPLSEECGISKMRKHGLASIIAAAVPPSWRDCQRASQSCWHPGKETSSSSHIAFPGSFVSRMQLVKVTSQVQFLLRIFDFNQYLRSVKAQNAAAFLRVIIADTQTPTHPGNIDYFVQSLLIQRCI